MYAQCEMLNDKRFVLLESSCCGKFVLWKVRAVKRFAPSEYEYSGRRQYFNILCTLDVRITTLKTR